MSSKLKNRFWLWGQDAGSHHASSANKQYKLPSENRMGPAEGADYMGIDNMCRVVMGGKPEPPFDLESEKLRFIENLIWSAMGDGGSLRNDLDKSDIDEVIRQAEKYPNVKGAVLDDFFKIPGGSDTARLSLEQIKLMSAKLHNFSKRKLDLWVVLYKRQLDYPVQNFLQYCDVITLWNMDASSEIDGLDKDFEKFEDLTSGKRRLNGCYMWNYGRGRPLTVQEIKTECGKYLEWILQGRSEGIIFCSNCCADLGLEAIEWIRSWIKEVGEQEI